MFIKSSHYILILGNVGLQKLNCRLTTCLNAPQNKTKNTSGNISNRFFHVVRNTDQNVKI